MVLRLHHRHSVRQCAHGRVIKPMGDASEAILALRPVTFRYEGDTINTPQFGLIAEEVAKVNPALILVDKEGNRTASAMSTSTRCCSMSFSKSITKSRN